MCYFEQHKEFYSKPVKLTKEQQENPLKFITEFFGDIHLVECRIHLSELLECALTSHNSEFSESQQRDTIVLFARRVEQLIEAAYLLKDRH